MKKEQVILSFMLAVLFLAPAVQASPMWCAALDDGAYFCGNGTSVGNGTDFINFAGGGSGSVQQVDTGNGLSGGPITVTGTINVDAPTTNATQALGWNGTNFTLQAITGGGGSGTVTSINVTPIAGNGSVFGSGGPVTTSGTISLLFYNATTTQTGLLKASDFVAFNNKGSSNLTLDQIAANIGNWSGNQSNYVTTSTFNTAINNIYVNTTALQALTAGLYTNTTALQTFRDAIYVNVTNLQSSNASTNTRINTINTSIDNLYINVSNLQNSNSSTNTRIDTLNSTKAGVGNCPAGQFVQNTTTGGVQCSTTSSTDNYTVSAAFTAAGLLWTLNLDQAIGNNISASFTQLDNYTTSASVIGTTTKTLNLAQTTGNNISASWTDLDTTYTALYGLNLSATVIGVNAPTTGASQALGYNGSNWTIVSTGGTGSGNVTSSNGTANALAIFTNSTNIAALQPNVCTTGNYSAWNGTQFNCFPDTSSVSNSTGGGANNVSVENNGTAIITNVTTWNFVGNAVAVTNVSNVATINITGAHDVCNSGVASQVTSSLTEFNLVNCTIPAGMMGTEGSFEVWVTYKFTGTTNTKTMSMRLSTTKGDTTGGFRFQSNSDAATALSDTATGRFVSNTGTATAQVTHDCLQRTFGQSTGAVCTGSVNTSQTTYVMFNGFVANAADTIQVVSYRVTVHPGVAPS